MKPAQESASPIEEQPTLNIRIKRAKKVQVDAIPMVAPPAILPLLALATKVVRKKRGRAAPPSATAPVQLNPGAGAKRFRPTKKVKRGDSTPEVPPAPAPGGPKVLNVKKKVPSKAVKKPSASGFQPCPLNDADWD
ncbi:hypothetical protein PtB15_15B190 [Puccinia triticina]|nr:hypothetical protein PtB15_15B190 [Puccinia triticina]